MRTSRLSGGGYRVAADVLVLGERARGVLMERRAIAVYGIVQGTGFRLFAYGLATRLQLGDPK